MVVPRRLVQTYQSRTLRLCKWMAVVTVRGNDARLRAVVRKRRCWGTDKPSNRWRYLARQHPRRSYGAGNLTDTEGKEMISSLDFPQILLPSSSKIFK